jgi:alpha-L-fucosidase
MWKHVLFAALTMAAAERTLPNAMQLKYQSMEVSMFMHFSMCTYGPNGGCEQDTACRTNPPSLFQPIGLNTTQWMETAKALGAKEVCLTSHHTGGFALFPTKHTSYGVKESTWRDGHGDVVKEFVDSCRQYDISPCLYFINAWDCWESGDAASVYLDRQLGMLSDLMNVTTYGKIDRFWFDQFGFSSRNGQSPAGLFPAAWKNVTDHVHAVSPGTMMLPGPDGCLNPGEGGGGVYPVVHYVNDTTMCSYASTAANKPSPTGQIYVPYESDLSIQNPGDRWFYQKGHVYDDAANLWGKYLATVGRGSRFILNVPPNTTGVIPHEFVHSVTQMGDAVRDSFGTDMGKASAPVTNKCSQISVVAEATGSFDAVIIMEDLTHGQVVLGYSLEVQHATTKQWEPVSLDRAIAGQTVGHKVINQIPASDSRALRWNCTSAMGGADADVTIAAMSLHKLRPPPPPPPAPAKLLSLRTYVNGATQDDDNTPCAARNGGACTTYTSAGFTLLRVEGRVWSSPAAGATRRIDLIYDLALDDNSLSDGTSAFTPAGYANESSTGETFYVFPTQVNASLVPLDVYFSGRGSESDHWVLASSASRAVATERGYVKLGTIGYVAPA